jgi:hypothetical protein
VRNTVYFRREESIETLATGRVPYDAFWTWRNHPSAVRSIIIDGDSAVHKIDDGRARTAIKNGVSIQYRFQPR